MNMNTSHGPYNKEVYLNALNKLAQNSWEISKVPHSDSIHAYFMYQDENTKINVIEVILIKPSYNYDFELHIRQSSDITATYTDFTECPTTTLEAVYLGLFKDDSKQAQIDEIVDIAINMVKPLIDDKVLLMFDPLIDTHNYEGELVRAKLVDYTAYDLVCYCDDETAELFNIPIGSLKYVIHKPNE